jgi:hypothetical protein
MKVISYCSGFTYNSLDLAYRYRGLLVGDRLIVALSLTRIDLFIIPLMKDRKTKSHDLKPILLSL